MKNQTILLISFTLLCLRVFAQNDKPCLFIGYYSDKEGDCGDRIWVKEEIKDREEFNQRTLQFKAEHPYKCYTEFVSEKQSVLVCEFVTNRSVFNCYPKGVKSFIAYTIEDCRRMFEQDIALYAKNRTVQPTNIYERQSKGGAEKQTLKEDFGGVSGTFSLVDKAGGGSFIVAQLLNKTTDKLATVLLQLADGTMEVVYLEPGVHFTKKYDARKLEIQVLYQDSKKPKPEIDIINFVKEKVKKQVVNENGELKLKPTAITGVRG